MNARPLASLLLVPALSMAFASSAHAQGPPTPSATSEEGEPISTPPTGAQQQYTAPLYQHTQPTYVPQSVAMSGPHELRDWDEGEPIPAGYHPVERLRKGLIIGGAVTFGSLYLISLFVAAAGSDSTEPGQSNTEAAMWIPVAGPFVQMAHTDSATGNLFLAIDGLAQAAGVTMLAFGLFSPTKVLIRNDLAGKNALKLSVAPILAKNMSGFGLTGSF